MTDARRRAPGPVPGREASARDGAGPGHQDPEASAVRWKSSRGTTRSPASDPEASLPGGDEADPGEPVRDEPGQKDDGPVTDPEALRSFLATAPEELRGWASEQLAGLATSPGSTPHGDGQDGAGSRRREQEAAGAASEPGGHGSEAGAASPEPRDAPVEDPGPAPGSTTAPAPRDAPVEDPEDLAQDWAASGDGGPAAGGRTPGPDGSRGSDPGDEPADSLDDEPAADVEDLLAEDLDDLPDSPGGRDADPASRTSSRTEPRRDRAPSALQRRTGVSRLTLVLVALLSAAVVVIIQQAGRGSATAEATMPADHPSVAASPTALSQMDEAQPVDTERETALKAEAEADPANFSARQELGVMYLQAALYQDAITWLQQILDVDPDNQDALLTIGVAEYQSNQYEAAERHWLRASELSPEAAEPWYNLGFLYMAQNPPDTERATQCWNKVLEIAPDSEMAATVRSHEGRMASTPTGGPGGGGASDAPSASTSGAATPAPSAGATGG